MENTIIDQIYEENKELINFLNRNDEPSFSSMLDSSFKKNLLLSIGSFFENKIKSSSFAHRFQSCAF